jgi:hypothetical protein
MTGAQSGLARPLQAEGQRFTWAGSPSLRFAYTREADLTPFASLPPLRAGKGEGCVLRLGLLPSVEFFTALASGMEGDQAGGTTGVSRALGGIQQWPPTTEEGKPGRTKGAHWWWVPKKI